VWLDVERDDILKRYPVLADLLAAKASSGLDSVVSQLLEVLTARKESPSATIQPILQPGVELTANKPQPQAGTGELYIPPTVFFYDRVAEAFSGIRGLYETEDTGEIVLRLTILLRNPLSFEGYYPSFMTFDMRGGTRDIHSFRVLDKAHVLIECHELRLKKLAVFRPPSYWQYFVYLECQPDLPTGLYEGAREDEEYAIYQGESITRAEYDDGCIFRNGKSIPVTGAELRVRHLIPTNLVIASRFSPININAFDKERRSILQGILKVTKSLSDFVRALEQLPRHPKDS
jgi:hypothetical protein